MPSFNNYSLKCRSAVDGKVYFIPDTGAWQAGLTLNDAGALDLDYAIGGANADMLVSDSIVIAYNNGVEMVNGRYHVRAASGSDVSPDGYKKWIGPSVFAALDKVLVLGGPTQGADATVDFNSQTPGYILNYLFAAAQARGAMTGFSWTFTASLDSAGLGWAGPITRAIPVGTKYSDLMRALAEQGIIEFEMLGMEIKVYAAGNMSPDVKPKVYFTADLDYTETPYRKSIEDRAQFILVSGDDSKAATVDSGSYTGPFGREEVALTASTNDTAILGLVGATYSSANGTERAEYTRKCNVRPDGPRHGVDYKCGDRVGDRTATTSTPMRVREIVIDVDADNNAEVALTINDKFYDAEVKNQIRLDNLLGGVSAGGIPTKSEIDKTTPNKPTGLVVNSVPYTDSDGRTRSAATIDWNPPTTNTDGSAITDLADYEVQWRYQTGTTNETTWRSDRVGTDYAVVGNLNPGRIIEAKVQAWDQSGHASGFTVVATGTTASDVTPPSQPAAPTLTSLRGNIDVVHDWTKQGGGALEADTYSLEVHVSPTSGFTPSSATYYGSLLMAGRLTITGLTLTTAPYYVRVIAVDRSGNRSVVSVQASQTLNYVNVGDLASALNTKIDTAFANAQAALLLPSKVNNPTKSGTVANWSIVSGTGSIALEPSIDFYGKNIRAMKITASDNTQVVSDYFEVDTTKAYEVRCWLYDPTDPGNTGVQSYLGNNVVTSTGAISTLDQYQLSNGATSTNGNFYFGYTAAETAAGQWREMVAYVFPYNSDWNDVGKLGTNNLFNARFQQNAQRTRIRLLNWSNTGTPRDMWVANITITEMALADVKSAGVLEKWRVTGTTTFDGGMISADTIDASVAVRAHTVGADEMVIGGVTNLIPNGAGEYRALGGLWASPITFDGVDRPPGFAGAFDTVAGQGIYTPPVLWTECEPGEKFLFEVWVKASVANSKLFVEVRDQDNVLQGGTAVGTETFAGNSSYPVQALTVPTVWTRYSAEITASATSNRLKVGNIFFNHSSGSVTNAAVSIVIRMRARARGRLIVDGDITTRQIAAEGVDTVNLKAGSVDTSKVALGVLRTNPINNPGFEDGRTNGTAGISFTQITDPGQGDVNDWRSKVSNATNCSVYRAPGKSRSGAWRGMLNQTATGLATDYAELYSNAFLVEAGATYTVGFAAISNGPGAVAAGSRVYVDAIFGATQSSVAQGADTLSASDGTYFSVPYSTWAGITPDAFAKFLGDFTVPAGQTNLWCSIRFRQTGIADNIATVVDDVSCIKQGVGGAAELTAAGLRLFADSGDEVIAIMSNRPNYFSIQDPTTGETVLSAEPDGTFSASAVLSNNDMSVRGRPLVGLTGDTMPFDLRTTAGDDPTRDYDADPIGIIESYAKGTVQWQIFDPSVFTKTVASNGAYLLFDVAFDIEPGRQYTPFCSPITVAGTAGTVAAMVMRYTTNGTMPTTGSAVLCRLYSDIGSTGNVQIFMPPGRLFNGIVGQEKIRILGIFNAFGSSMTVEAFENFTVGLIDLGITKSAEGRTINSTTTTSGGSNITKTYVSTWKASGSESYGNYGARPEANLYQGYYSGNQDHQWASIVFNNGAISGQTGTALATAMSGATVKKVEVWLKNADWYNNSGGTAVIRAQTSTSLISTTPGGTAKNFGWKVSEGKWVDITSIATGSIRGITLGKAPSTSVSYYGQFLNHSSKYPPLLRVTYSKTS